MAEFKIQHLETDMDGEVEIGQDELAMLRKRCVLMEARLDQLEVAVGENVRKLAEMEEAVNSKRLVDTSKFITKGSMGTMVECAIARGSAEYGVSRTFIRKVLLEDFSVPMSAYYNKKLSLVLNSLIKDGKIVHDTCHQLFRLKPCLSLESGNIGHCID